MGSTKSRGSFLIDSLLDETRKQIEASCETNPIDLINTTMQVPLNSNIHFLTYFLTHSPYCFYRFVIAISKYETQ